VGALSTCPCGRNRPSYIQTRMIRISITAAAFEAIAALPVGLAADVAALKETVAVLRAETRTREEPPPEAAA
jgi:hypothetical protein